MYRDLNEWFYSLEPDQLVRMFDWPEGYSTREFLDSCDDYWNDLTAEEREDFYQKHR
jgi:hypothetical protein